MLSVTMATRWSLLGPGVVLMFALLEVAGGQDNCGGYGDDERLCKSSDEQPVCSGHGTCFCGVCECDQIAPDRDPTKRYSGQYCECNDYSCDYYNNMICGGPTRGRCMCGECRCRMGYTGPACDCPTSQDTCLASNGMVCNGKGSCVCGRCECILDQYYRGPTCEECPTCPNKCSINRDCARCVAFKSGPLDEDACSRKCSHVNIVTSLDGIQQSTNCTFRDDDNCQFHFAYSHAGGRVWVVGTKECPPLILPPAEESKSPSSSSFTQASQLWLLVQLLVSTLTSLWIKS